MQLTSIFLPLVSSTSIILGAASSPLPSASTIEPRQLGGGPGDSEVGTGWSTTWRDSQISRPMSFDAIPRGGCSYDLVFNRDVRDRKYKLAYYSIFGEGEVETQQLLKPINLQYRGSVNSDGRQEYYAFVENACSTFFTDKRPPRLFKTYFTESRDSKTNWISPKYY